MRCRSLHGVAGTARGIDAALDIVQKIVMTTWKVQLYLANFEEIGTDLGNTLQLLLPPAVAFSAPGRSHLLHGMEDVSRCRERRSDY